MPSSIIKLAALSGMLATALAAPAAGLGSGSIAKRSFSASCDRWDLTQQGSNAWLEAYCQIGDGDQYHSVINLNNCIEDLDSAMVGGPGGDFAASCNNMYLDAETNLHATCGDGAESTINLDTVLSNENGELACYTFVGCAVDAEGCTDKPS
ncbi:CVNH domain-containing protein [Xylariaceae sp. FL0804]|nr:CVNH domain-containing protein [Xylariaceae sp. FL0804]